MSHGRLTLAGNAMAADADYRPFVIAHLSFSDWKSGTLPLSLSLYLLFARSLSLFLALSFFLALCLSLALALSLSFSFALLGYHTLLFSD